jgi:hypothetical protein
MLISRNLFGFIFLGAGMIWKLSLIGYLPTKTSKIYYALAQLKRVKRGVKINISGVDFFFGLDPLPFFSFFYIFLLTHKVLSFLLFELKQYRKKNKNKHNEAAVVDIFFIAFPFSFFN